MEKTCYMCEKEATSLEHVPPKCLFPEKKDLPEGIDFRKNLITVPSCDEHNSQKSKDDEYLLFLLLSAKKGNIDKERHLNTKFTRAVNRTPHVYNSFCQNKSHFLSFEEGDINVESSFFVDIPRFENAIKHIALGLYYNHYGKKWNGSFRMFSSEMINEKSFNSYKANQDIHETASKIACYFEKKEARGENPQIFMYKWHTEGEGGHAIFMDFYEGFEITVVLRAFIKSVS